MELVKLQHESKSQHRLIDPNTLEGFDTDERGVVSVPEWTAGYEPTGTPGEKGYDPGAGALAGPWKRVPGDPSPYAGSSKAQLVEEAERRGLDTSGTKAALTARLEAHDEAAMSGREN